MHVDWDRIDTDHSIERGRSLWAPTDDLVAYWNMKYRADAEWIGAEQTIVAFDPAGTTDEPSRLLIRKDIFDQYLKEKSLQFGWEVQQEKIVQYRKPELFGKSSGLVLLNGSQLDLSGISPIVVDRY